MMEHYSGQDALQRFVDGVSAKLQEGKKLHGRREFQDMPISIENRVGSVRRGVDPDGEPWETKMLKPYGYIRGTEGTDGDHLDVYVGDNEEAPYVYIVHVKKAPSFKEFDEDKVFLGFNSKEAVQKLFAHCYDDPKFYGGMTQVPIDTFKKLVNGRNSHKERLTADKIEEWAEAELKDIKESGIKGMKWGERKETFHGTDVGNVKNILKKGLLPSRTEGQVFLTKKKSEAIGYGSTFGSYASGEDTFAVVVLKPEAGSKMSTYVRGELVAKKIPPDLISRVELYDASSMKLLKVVHKASDIKESNPFLESRRPVIYYARPLQKYGTKAEAREVAAIKEAFPDHRIAYSKEAHHEDYGMGYYHDRVDNADMVIMSPRRKRKVTAGVYSEAKHARHKGIPVKFIDKHGRIHTLGKCKSLGGAPFGDFAEVQKRRKPRLKESGVHGMHWGQHDSVLKKAGFQGGFKNYLLPNSISYHHPKTGQEVVINPKDESWTHFDKDGNYLSYGKGASLEKSVQQHSMR